MVAPIRDLRNKFISLFSNTILPQSFQAPTVSHISNTRMDFFAGNIPDNYDEVRGRSLSTKENLSKDSSMSSIKSSIVYYEKIERNNAMDVNNVNDVNPALSYETSQELAL